MPLKEKVNAVPHLKALISGQNISTSQVRGSTLTGPTLFQKLPVLHHREAKSRFFLLLAVYLSRNVEIKIKHAFNIVIVFVSILANKILHYIL